MVPPGGWLAGWWICLCCKPGRACLFPWWIADSDDVHPRLCWLAVVAGAQLGRQKITRMKKRESR